MKAILLAAGYGTRLYPLAKNTPKVLIKISNIPIIERIIGNINNISEIDDVYIITNDKFYSNISSWLESYISLNKLCKNISVVNDGTSTNDSRIGPIGDIVFVIKKYNIKDDILIVAGDNLFDTPITNLYTFWKSKNGAVLAIYDYKSIEKVKNKFGIVLVNDQRRIISFEEKPDSPKSSLAATALYLLRGCDVDIIREFYSRNKNRDLNSGDIIKELLRNGVPVYGEFLNEWFDIGSYDDLERAQSYYSGK
jgi:glucose-1-phosphate thymidylyltransferase